MKYLNYLDLHVAGEPFRLITDGFPDIKGTTMAEKRMYAMKHLDDVRKLVILEPRGHADMYGGFLTPPVNSSSDLGVVFIHGSGMSTMCGHGVIALARAAVELGIVSLEGSATPVRIDAPSGTVSLTIHAAKGRIESIALQNTLSFPYAINQQIKTSSYGKINVDIGYGGAFMVFADIRQFHTTLKPENISVLLSIAMECGEAAIAQLPMIHPANPARNAKTDGICMILTDLQAVDSEQIFTRTFTVFGQSQFDRSPTGTGTSALAAVLCKKGLLSTSKVLINSGISGIPFRTTVEIANNKIIPTIYSNAYLTGKGTIILEDQDPLQNGLFFNPNGNREI